MQRGGRQRARARRGRSSVSGPAAACTASSSRAAALPVGAASAIAQLRAELPAQHRDQPGDGGGLAGARAAARSRSPATARRRSTARRWSASAVGEQVVEVGAQASAGRGRPGGRRRGAAGRRRPAPPAASSGRATAASRPSAAAAPPARRRSTSGLRRARRDPVGRCPATAARPATSIGSPSSASAVIGRRGVGEVEHDRAVPGAAHGQRDREQHPLVASRRPARRAACATCTSAGASTPASSNSREQARRPRGSQPVMPRAPPASRSDAATTSAAGGRHANTPGHRAVVERDVRARTCRAGTGTARRRGARAGS